MEEKVFQGRLEEKSKADREPLPHGEQAPAPPACLLRDIPTPVLSAEDSGPARPRVKRAAPSPAAAPLARGGTADHRALVNPFPHV